MIIHSQLWFDISDVLCEYMPMAISFSLFLEVLTGTEDCLHIILFTTGASTSSDLYHRTF